LLIVEVPNHLGIVNQAFRQSEDVPRHLYSFSTRTLREYYKKVGLRVIRIETQTRHPHDVYSQLGRWATEMTKGENLRPRLEAEIARFWSVRNRTRQLEYMATAKFFDSVGCGSSVIAIGTKD
jgi:collagenase-like PrtC family protease